MRKFYLLYLLCLFFRPGHAQESILFMNGKEMEVKKVIGLQDKYVVYKRLSDSAQKKVAVNKVYSVKSGQQEKVLYRADSAVEYILTPAQMGMYIKGEQAAISYFNPRPFFFCGIGCGAIGGCAIPFFASLCVLPPAIGAISVSGTTPSPLKNKTLTPALANDQDFIAGYQLKTKSLRLQKTLVGSAIGILGTFTVLVLKGTFK